MCTCLTCFLEISMDDKNSSIDTDLYIQTMGPKQYFCVVVVDIIYFYHANICDVQL